MASKKKSGAKKVGKAKTAGSARPAHRPAIMEKPRLFTFKLDQSDWDTLSEIAKELGQDKARFVRRVLFAAFREHGREPSSDY